MELCVKGQALSLQQLGSPAVVWVGSLAQELPHAVVAEKKKKKKKKSRYKIKTSDDLNDFHGGKLFRNSVFLD